MTWNQKLLKSIEALKQGKVIAYPTEGVYGLGCDPFNKAAVMDLLDLKSRSVYKGLLLVAYAWDQIAYLTEVGEVRALKSILDDWPGPYTWVFPASQHAPDYICGDHTGIALRVSAHPVVQALTKGFGGPIVSTSANIQGGAPCFQFEAVKQLFGDKVSAICPGELGGLGRATTLRDALTGVYIRT